MGNTTGILSFVQGVNETLMLGWLGVLILIVILSIAFITFLKTTDNFAKSLAATGFLAIGFSLLLKSMALIPNLAFFISVIVGAAACAVSIKAS